MSHITVDVDVDITEFTDAEIMEEAEARGLITNFALESLSVELQKQVRKYLSEKIVGPEDLEKYLEWARQ